MCCGEFCEAKSVFAVAGHANGKIKAYRINGDEIEFQETIPHPLTDATGLCLWPTVDRMFVTYEGSGVISWASIKNLNRDPETDDFDTMITGGNGLGGMAVDEDAGVMYVLSRGTGKLYAFSYDGQANTLIPQPLGDTTAEVTLTNVGTGMDIALDEDGSSVMGLPCGRLYVSDMNSDDVRYYNTITWNYEGSITLGHPAVGIGLDRSRGYLYGGFFPGGGGQNYLMRYDLEGDPNDPNTYLEYDMEAPVMDIAVDEDTGYIYLTTYRLYDGRVGAVEVYDPTGWVANDANSLVLLDIVNDADFGGDNNGPAGIAVGPTYKAPRMFVEKVDDVNELSESVLPTDEFTYSITVRPGPLDETNVVVTDFLPWGVDFVSADPNDAYYDSESHAVVWAVGDLPGYDPNEPGDPNEYFALTVRVNYLAEPLSDLENIVVAESDEAYKEAREYTPVDCFGGDVIFVDCFATGSGSGTSWTNAYNKLEDALARAGEGCGDEIWVAQGLYSPGTDYDDTFGVPAGVSVLGGFCGTETNVTERDLSRYKTILSGQNVNQAVVTMGWGASLDGLVIEEAYWYGVSGTDVPFSVQNSIVKANGRDGIYCEDGRLTVTWSEVTDNGWRGIWLSSQQPTANRELRVFNSRVHGNQYDGIRAVASAIEIRDSLVYANGLGGDYYGINVGEPIDGGIIHNNTVAHNSKEGIHFAGTNLPDVRNCILWGNAATQLSGLDEDTVYWCCIQDCNDINQGYNINDDPLFAYSQEPYGLYHLSADSPCIDVGDPTYVDPNGTGEWDIDGDDRIINDYVDIGADEFSCEALTNSIDWTFDGIIDPAELAIFAAAWLSSDPNEPGITTDPNYIGQPQYRDPEWFVNWDGRCDLNSDYWIDFGDWAYFAYYWRWRACWRDSGYGVWALGESGLLQGGGQLEMMALSQPVAMAERVEAYPAEPTVEEEYAQAKEIVAWLEDLWANDEEAREVIDKKAWKEFMDQIYTWVANVEQEL